MSKAFDKLIDEARTELGTREADGIDWSKVDAGLFARIDRERRAERARFSVGPGRATASVAVAMAAAAAVVAVVAGRGHELRQVADGIAASAESAGSVLAVDGAGQALVDGLAVTPGAPLRLGDVIEARGAQVTIERPGKLTLILEPGSRAVVTHVQGGLIVALVRGAIDAQVVPVSSGEAFAVDVDGSRVAVHGTKLRVARADDRVTVDLSEGVVALGKAPRLGSVLGALVTAPAHAEFASATVLETLTVTHELSAVREPVTRASPEPVGPQAAAPRREWNAPRPAAAAAAPVHAENRPPPSPAMTPQPALVEPNPEGAITAAVRACMAERPRVSDITVVVNTTLHLELGDDGSVRAARFDPPVAPDVNGCAAQSIYKTHFAHGGAVAIGIDFSN
jgi:hypothetical protein